MPVCTANPPARVVASVLSRLIKGYCNVMGRITAFIRQQVKVVKIALRSNADQQRD
jgi:hypothetical protein